MVKYYKGDYSLLDDIYDDIEEKLCIENTMKMLMNAVTT